MKKIVTVPAASLREKSDKVRQIDDEIRQMIAEMRTASLEWEKAHPYELSAAMAAPQLGFNKRIIIVRDDFDDKDTKTFTALINPEIIRTEGKMVEEQEGCLSVPEIYGLVKRHDKVKVKALLEDGQEVRIRASGYLARTLQHEIDHLDGVLFIDHIKERPKAFFRMDKDGNLQPIIDYKTEILQNQTLWGEE